MILIGVLILIWAIIWIVLKNKDNSSVTVAVAVSGLLCEGGQLSDENIKEKMSNNTFTSDVNKVIKQSGLTSNITWYMLSAVQIILALVLIVWGISLGRKHTNIA